MKIRVIHEIGEYNEKKWGRPWVAMADPKGGMYFSKLIGGFKNGKIYFNDEFVENDCVYARGQKDYQGKGSFTHYYKFKDDNFIEIDKAEAKSLAKSDKQRKVIERIKKQENEEAESGKLAETYSSPNARLIEKRYPELVREMFPDWGKKAYTDRELQHMASQLRAEKRARG